MTTSLRAGPEAAHRARALVGSRLRRLLSPDERRLRPPAMIACAVAGSMPNVGGSSAASSTPSLPLVPAPTKISRPPFMHRVGHDLRAARDARFLALHGGEHASVVEHHHLDNLVGRQRVDVAAARD